MLHKVEACIPLLHCFHLLCFMHELLLDFGHVVVALHHFCIVVRRPLPRGACLLKLANSLLCSCKSLQTITPILATVLPCSSPDVAIKTGVTVSMSRIHSRNCSDNTC